MLILLFLCKSGYCEEGQALLDALDLSEMAALGEESGFDVRKWIGEILAGDLSAFDANTLKSLAKETFGALAGDAKRLLTELAVPIMAMLLLRIAISRSGGAIDGARFVERACLVAILTGAFSNVVGVARRLFEIAVRLSDALTPVMLAAITLSGAEASAAVLSPMSSIGAELIQNVLGRWSMALSAAAAGIAVAGNLSNEIRLKRLHALIRQLHAWFIGATMTGFMGMLAVQGRIGAGRDTAAARTARFAVENIVPIIGGNVSDSLDALLATAVNVKTAVGVAGLMLIAGRCLPSILRIAGMSLLLKLASAAAEPLGDEPATSLLTQFATAAEMLLASALAAAILCAMLTGSCLLTMGAAVR